MGPIATREPEAEGRRRTKETPGTCTYNLHLPRSQVAPVTYTDFKERNIPNHFPSSSSKRELAQGRPRSRPTGLNTHPSASLFSPLVAGAAIFPAAEPNGCHFRRQQHDEIFGALSGHAASPPRPRPQYLPLSVPSEAEAPRLALGVRAPPRTSSRRHRLHSCLSLSHSSPGGNIPVRPSSH